MIWKAENDGRTTCVLNEFVKNRQNSSKENFFMGILGPSKTEVICGNLFPTFATKWKTIIILDVWPTNLSKALQNELDVPNLKNICQ